ncbi:hypothetical protein M5K25_001414 [Dendrobium thyrsiflorum]|uniref:Uncharacterized protein n=1 Tax=Dendrobium thyrsiflorum TaxID=117978 RepID=A0ABD0VXM1_DENTH
MGVRPSIARVLVEIDVTKKYSDFVWICSKTLGFRQRVELEDFPSYCDHCKVLGHSNVECCVLNPSLATSSLPCEECVVKPAGGIIPLVDPVIVDVSGKYTKVMPVEHSVLVNNVPVDGLKGSLVEDVQCFGHLESRVADEHQVLFNLAEVHEDVVFNSGGSFKSSCFFSQAAVGDGISDALPVTDSVEEGFRVESVSVSALIENVVGEDGPLRSSALVPDNLVDVPISVESPTGLHKLAVSNLGVTCSGKSLWSHGYPSAGEGERDLEGENHDTLIDLYGLDVCKVTEKVLSQVKHGTQISKDDKFIQLGKRRPKKPDIWKTSRLGEGIILSNSSSTACSCSSLGIGGTTENFNVKVERLDTSNVLAFLWSQEEFESVYRKCPRHVDAKAASIFHHPIIDRMMKQAMFLGLPDLQQNRLAPFVSVRKASFEAYPSCSLQKEASQDEYVLPSCSLQKEAILISEQLSALNPAEFNEILGIVHHILKLRKPELGG